MGPAPTMITCMALVLRYTVSVIVTLRMLSSTTELRPGRDGSRPPVPLEAAGRASPGDPPAHRRAGGELYVERGYGPTTIDAIAERAEVSRKTVFTSVGGKAAVLKLAFDWALAGDDEPVAIADRPEVRRMMQEQDPAAFLAAWIAMNAAIAGRLAALHHVLVVAADADPEAAAILATTEQQRRHGALALVTRLEAIGGLRPGLDVDRAAAITEVLMDPLPYRRLVAPAGLDARGVHRVPPADSRSCSPAVSPLPYWGATGGPAGIERATPC